MCGGCCQAAQRLVTDAEVARRLGVPRAQVPELVGRPGFPASLGEIESSSPPVRRVPFWLWSDVKRWAEESGAVQQPEAPLAS